MLHILYTIPVTSATAERTFSALRRLKSYLRSTMLPSCLDHCMLLHIHKDLTDEINLINIVESYAFSDDLKFKIFLGGHAPGPP